MKTQVKNNKKTVHKKLVLKRPFRPLYSDEHKLGLFASAKAGCTFAVKWYFFQINMLDMAMFYNPWVHKFRISVFYKSKTYRENINKILDGDSLIIKFVRNPYLRTVSSYLHAAKYGYEDANLSSFLNRRIDDNQGFTFDEFIAYLESINLNRCNAHHMIQVHPAEENGFVKIDFPIHIENSFDELPIIEEKCNLKRSDLADFRKSRHHTNRGEDGVFCGEKLFRRRDLKAHAKIPTSSSFYNKSLKDKVSRIYAIDFKTYNYSDSEIPK